MSCDARIPSGVHVAAHGAEIRPHGGERAHVTDLALFHEFLHLEDAGIEQENVADHEHETLAFCQRDELVALGGVDAQRLLAEDVLARIQRIGDDLEVGPRGRHDHDCIHAALSQQRSVIRKAADVREHLADGREALRIRIRDGGHGAVLHLRKGADVVRPPMAAADHANAQVGGISR